MLEEKILEHLKGKRLMTLEEKMELLKCKHEHMDEIEGFSHDNGIGVVNYCTYVCPECGFEIPFHSTQTQEQLQKSWEAFILESEMYVSKKEDDL